MTRVSEHVVVEELPAVVVGVTVEAVKAIVVAAVAIAELVGLLDVPVAEEAELDSGSIPL